MKQKSRRLKAIAPVDLAGDGARTDGQDAGAANVLIDSTIPDNPPVPCHFCDGPANGRYIHGSGIDLPICSSCAELFGFPIHQAAGHANN